MPSKNLTVKKEVYIKLLAAKRANESFSEVIERLLEAKQDLMSFAGVFSKDKQFEEVMKKVGEGRPS